MPDLQGPGSAKIGPPAASPASAARPAHESTILNLHERRIARDGGAYTFEEFATHYGVASGFAFWQESECLDSAEQPGDITASLPEDSAEQPVDTTTVLQRYSQQESPFAVDITATCAIPWHRWLRNVVANRELIGCGIVKVFALCQTSTLEAQIVFRHPDDAVTVTNGEKLHVFHNHSPSSDKRRLTSDQRKRLTSTFWLHVVKKTSAAQPAVVFGGDFNNSPLEWGTCFSS